jgi:hypothetical protein
MELSGNIEEDLEHLIFSYNLYGCKVLTEVKEINSNILKFLNLKDLVNFSMINHKAVEIFDDDFWILKHIHDDLPVIPGELGFKAYKAICEAKFNAKYIIEVNHIEMKRDNIIGLIRIYYHKDNNLLKNILSVIKNEVIQQTLNTINDTEKRLNIGIIPLDKDKYQIKFYYDVGDKKHIILLSELHCNYKMTLSILTLVQFNTLKDDIYVTDQYGLTFIVKDDFLFLLKIRLPDRYRQHKRLLVKRMGIYDILKYSDSFNL